MQGDILFKGGIDDLESCDRFATGGGCGICDELPFPPYWEFLSPDLQSLRLGSTGSGRGVAVGLGLGPVLSSKILSFVPLKYRVSCIYFLLPVF